VKRVKGIEAFTDNPQPAQIENEHHCSPVLRPYVVTTRLREGFLLRLAFRLRRAYGGQDGGQDGEQAGDSERRRGGAAPPDASAGLV
jgi:hypothetical protein